MSSLDFTQKNLTKVPEEVLQTTNLTMLFMGDNRITRLPKDFFNQLPNLQWLDLRRNLLVELPKSVAYHQNLGHLLLTENSIKKLPNELGLVPNLIGLQVAGNPLIYPARGIIQRGTKSILSYLKTEYYKEKQNEAEDRKLDQQLKDLTTNMAKFLDIGEDDIKYTDSIPVFDENVSGVSLWMQEEKLISVHEINSIENKDQTKTLSNVAAVRPAKKVMETKVNDNRLKKKAEIHNAIKDVLPKTRKPAQPTVKTRHKSSFANLPIVESRRLKDEWLNTLKMFLEEQDRILQQERNLTNLSAWRRKAPAPRIDSESSSATMSEAPYATDPEYSKFPNRAELTSKLLHFLKDSDRTSSLPSKHSKMNLDKVISDLTEELKKLENSSEIKIKSPRSQMEHARTQLKMIAEIHTKLLRLKLLNDRH